MTMKMPVILTIIAMATGACANDPQYVECGTGDGSDVCTLDSNMGSSVGTGDDAIFVVTGSLHVPVMPPDSSLTKTTEQLQATMPADVTVPVYRIDMYDLSVEWTLRNLDDKDTSAAVALNAANEDFAWDPTIIKPASDEDPPPPSLQGNIPFDVPANAEISGEFTEDQLLEAAIDLDEITRGNINMYAATLVVSKDDQSFQPLSAEQPPPPDSDDPPTQTPMGDPVPRAAFRQIIRVDLALLPSDSSVHLTLQFDIRVRPQITNVIDSMGMNAPASQLMIIDPPKFMPAYTP
jgi:hypothetical protein